MTAALQTDIPGLGGALVPGPVFFAMTVAGPPVPKGRHRSRIIFPKAGKPFVHTYPDAATAAYEAMLAEYAALKMRTKAPTSAPLCLLVIADVRIPPSWPTKDRDAALNGRRLPTSRPDFDNYGKIVDALNDIVWVDDSQIIDGRIIKRYSASPALTIEVREFIAP